MKQFNNYFNKPLSVKTSTKYCSGFSLLEIIVVVIIVSILFTFALSHLFKWRITAERSSFKKLTSEMSGALKLEVSSHYAKGRLQDIVKLLGSNPLNYAIEKPQHYIGEKTTPNLTELNPGDWVYDTSKKILIYRVRYPEHFSTKLPGIKRIELKISLLYTDIDKNSKFNLGVDAIEGLRLVSTEPYAWVIE